jgi:hypothetical protein
MELLAVLIFSMPGQVGGLPQKPLLNILPERTRVLCVLRKSVMGL